ncbi:MAG: hypothetical protein PVSMB1_16800 [Gemmatimonadaceae bacterium]
MLARFIREDEGQDLVEYGLLAGLITAAAIIAITAIGPKVSAYFTTLNNRLP